MRRVTQKDRMAGWVAPPEIGIDNSSLEYEYVPAELNRRAEMARPGASPFRNAPETNFPCSFPCSAI